MNPLFPLHEAAGAETQAYDAIEIVSTFGQPQAEYAAIRKSAALMDLPQRGIIEITGKDRHVFLNNLISNQTWDLAAKTPLPAGRVVYAFLLNLKGRVVLDLNLIELGDRTLLELDVRFVDLLAKYLDRYLFAEQVKITPRADLHELAVYGPRAAEILVAETPPLGGTGAPPVGNDPGDAGEAPVPLGNGAFSIRFAGHAATVWRDDVCGVPGYHLIVPANAAAEIWQHLLTTHGDEYAVNKRLLRPAGWAAFNACRIEAGRPLFGVDFENAEPSMPGKKADADTPEDARPRGALPAETGLFDRAVSVTKGCYLGQEIVARMHARGQVARQLVGLRIEGDALPIAGQPVMDDKDNPVGVVTSSTMSPLLGDAAIALATVKKPNFSPGTALRVPAEGKIRVAHVAKLPFL